MLPVFLVSSACYLVPRIISYFTPEEEQEVQPNGLVDAFEQSIKPVSLLQRIKRDPIFHACYDNLWIASFVLFYIAVQNPTEGDANSFFNRRTAHLMTGSLATSICMHLFRTQVGEKFPSIKPSKL